MNGEERQLLERYVRDGSEEAFAQLVHRYVDLVWSAGRRVTGDADLARDVAQSVFADLAWKARRLPPETVLAGWLYRAACMAGAKLVRSNARRAQREKEAMDLQASTQTEPVGKVNELLSVLDEGLGQLGHADRDAVVLRFFAGKNFSEVGAALGVSDDTAQKRLSRAVEKLRKHFGRRGYAVSAGSVVSVLGAAGAQAAPVGVAGVLAASSLATAGSAVVSAGLSSTFASIPPQLAIMKTKIILAGLAVAAVSSPLLVQQQSLNQARADQQMLAARAGSLGDLRDRHASLLQASQAAKELGGLRKMEAELLRLRQEEAQLEEANLEAKRALQEQRRAARARRDQAAAKVEKLEQEEKFEASSTKIVNTMKNMGLAARIWAKDNEAWPPTFESMANELPGFSMDELKEQYEFAEHERPIEDTTHPDLILFREREPRPTPDGRWMRIYTLTDGSVQKITRSSPAELAEWENGKILRDESRRRIGNGR